MTLVDTNVLLDIATDDARWARWSLHQLDAAAIRGPVLINAVVYAEFSIGYSRIEQADRVLADVGLDLTEIPRAAPAEAVKRVGQIRETQEAACEVHVIMDVRPD